MTSTKPSRKLRLRTAQHSPLYSWCINEIDANGNVVGGDWIPFDWSIYFRGIDASVTYNVGKNRYPTRIHHRYQKGLM
jgi:hypothetical protein